MSDAPPLDTEAVFHAVRLALRTRAPLMHNLWCLVGRRQPVTIARAAEVLWYPEAPPASRGARHMRVGAFMAHLNKRIAKYDVIIKPGAARSTYQLYTRSVWEAEQEAAVKATQPSGKGRVPKLLTRKPRKPRAVKADKKAPKKKGGKT